MAIASAKARAKIIAVCTLGADSGLRPIASADFEPIQPIAIAGAMVPTMIVPMVAQKRTASISIMVVVILPTFL